MADPSLVLTGPLFWHYELLGVGISTEPLVDLNSPVEPWSSTAALRVDRTTLGRYLAATAIGLQLCCGSFVLATAHLPLSLTLQPGAHRSVQPLGPGPAKVEVELELFPTLPAAAPTTALDTLLEEIEIPETPAPASVLDRATHAPLDSTEYLAPPARTRTRSPSSPSFTPVPSQSAAPTTARPLSQASVEVSQAFRLTIKLSSFCLAPGQPAVPVSLAYKYTALSPHLISTGEFPASPGRVVSVPRPTTQFSFATKPAKMRRTFIAHKLRVGCYSEGGRVKEGEGGLELQQLLEGGSWRGELQLFTSAQPRTALATVTAELLLERIQEAQQDQEEQGKTGRQSIETEDLETAQAQLEQWKAEQKKKFNASLVELEQQHLAVLGEEWRARQTELQAEIQAKLPSIHSLEQELRHQVETIEVERKQMEEQRKKFGKEREIIERDRMNLKNEKSLIIDKLKKQLQVKEDEIATKKLEVDSLKSKLEAALRRHTLSLKRNSTVASSKDKKEEDTSARLLALQTENQTLTGRLAVAEQEKEMWRVECEAARQVQLQRECDAAAANERPRTAAPLPAAEVKRDGARQDREAATQTAGEAGRGVAEPADPRLEGLARLEEYRAMLQRTGVYSEQDPAVVQLTERIASLRRQLQSSS